MSEMFLKNIGSFFLKPGLQNFHMGLAGQGCLVRFLWFSSLSIPGHNGFLLSREVRASISSLIEFMKFPPRQLFFAIKLYLFTIYFISFTYSFQEIIHSILNGKRDNSGERCEKKLKVHDCCFRI